MLRYGLKCSECRCLTRLCPYLLLATAEILATKKIMLLLSNRIRIVEAMTTEEGSKSRGHSFLRFVIVSTLTVLGIALCILSPWVFIVALINLGLRDEPLNYIAFAAFWSFFIVIVILATAIDWINKRKKRE
jgi:hypothetical protein